MCSCRCFRIRPPASVAFWSWQPGPTGSNFVCHRQTLLRSLSPRAPLTQGWTAAGVQGGREAAGPLHVIGLDLPLFRILPCSPHFCPWHPCPSPWSSPPLATPLPTSRSSVWAADSVSPTPARRLGPAFLHGVGEFASLKDGLPRLTCPSVCKAQNCVPREGVTFHELHGQKHEDS